MSTSRLWVQEPIDGLPFELAYAPEIAPRIVQAGAVPDGVRARVVRKQVASDLGVLRGASLRIPGRRAVAVRGGELRVDTASVRRLHGLMGDHLRDLHYLWTQDRYDDPDFSARTAQAAQLYADTCTPLGPQSSRALVDFAAAIRPRFGAPLDETIIEAGYDVLDAMRGEGQELEGPDAIEFEIASLAAVNARSIVAAVAA